MGTLSICAYAKFTPVPFKEKELRNGYPEETAVQMIKTYDFLLATRPVGAA